MSDPLLSVVIPVASKRPGIDRCLESVAESLCKLDGWDQFEVRVKLSLSSSIPKNWNWRWNELFAELDFAVVSDQPREMADSWNECFRLARGQYIHVMHDDDWVRPDFYSAIWPHLLHSCDAVCTGYEVEEADGLVSFENRVKRQGGRLTEADLLNGNPLVPSCVVVRTASHLACGGYGSIGCMDWSLYLKLARYNNFYTIPELLVRQVRGPESQEGKSGRSLTCRQIAETIREWEARNGERMPARDAYLRQFVSEAVQRGDVELFEAALALR